MRCDFNICDVCGNNHAYHTCETCGLQLCDAHRQCPECEDFAPAPSEPEDQEEE